MGLVSTVGSTLNFTVHNQVMGGLSPSWDCLLRGWKYLSKVGLHVDPSSLFAHQEVENGTGPDSESQL